MPRPINVLKHLMVLVFGFSFPEVAVRKHTLQINDTIHTHA